MKQAVSQRWFIKKLCSEKLLKIHRQRQETVIRRCSVKRKDVFKNFAKFTKKHLCRSLSFNIVAGWKPETVRSSYCRCSVKQGVLKNFANFKGRNLCWSLFLIKLQFWWPATLWEKTLTQVLSCFLFWRKSTSKLYLKRDSNMSVFLWILWIIQEHLFCSGSTNGWFWNTSAGISLQ